MPNLDLHTALGLTFAAGCVSIVVAWFVLARARPALALGGVLPAFSAFILACALMRLMSISTSWRPSVGLAWVVDGGAAGLAVLASVMLWRSLPSRIKDELTAAVAHERRVAKGLATRIEQQAVEIDVANDRLRQILDSAMDAWVAVDDRQIVVLFNKAAAEMFGVDVDDAIGSSVNRFVPEPFRATRRMGASPSMSLVRANGERFAAEATISHIEVGGRVLATVIMRDITERQAAESARRLLAQEVDHRAKNALAVVQAVVSLTRAPTKEAFIEAVRGRISALARAHTILAENLWQGGDLHRIIAEETSPYERPGQVTVLGPSMVVNLSAVQPISLIVHELATNAMKYGALSVNEGRVDIELKILPGGDLQFSWTEHGGPVVAAPSTTGFGTTLMTQIANRQLGGVIDVAWPAGGMRLVATLPPSTYDQARAPPPMAPMIRETPAAHGGARRGKVLVVEDELLISLEICDGLRSIGWEIVGPAASVADAMRLIDIVPNIDLGILDINLAGEFAYPVADRLRSLQVPFVYCTGYEQPDHPGRRAEDTTMRKPVNMRLLTQHLRTLKEAA